MTNSNIKSKNARGTGKPQDQRQKQIKGNTIAAQKKQAARYAKTDKRTGVSGGAEKAARKKGTHKTYKSY